MFSIYREPTYKQLKYIVMMSSCGFLYYEALSETTSARNGVYYVTNTIEINPSTLLSDEVSKQADGEQSQSTAAGGNAVKLPVTAITSNSAANQFGGGVSVYYSFRLQLLFWSYQQAGRSFVGSFKPQSLILDRTFPLVPVKSATNITITQQQPLCNWSEIVGHPGLVMCMTLSSNNPVVLMLLPDRVFYQEIKLTNNQGGPTKAKIQDLVAIRHVSSSSSVRNSLNKEVVFNSSKLNLIKAKSCENLFFTHFF